MCCSAWKKYQKPRLDPRQTQQLGHEEQVVLSFKLLAQCEMQVVFS